MTKKINLTEETKEKSFRRLRKFYKRALGWKGRIDDRLLYDEAISVANIDKALEAVARCGGVRVGDKMEIPDVGWFANARDIEGNTFHLIQMIA